MLDLVQASPPNFQSPVSFLDPIRKFGRLVTFPLNPLRLTTVYSTGFISKPTDFLLVFVQACDDELGSAHQLNCFLFVPQV